jgi:MAE_28990/MAE_18760-like HEPN
MSKIRSLSQLNDRLTQDLAWRKLELSSLKNLIETKNTGSNKSFESSQSKVLTRSGVAILYAHWEGYIKCAAMAYLEFVSRRKLRYRDLTDNFVAISMKRKLAEASNASKSTVHNEVIKFIFDSMDQEIDIPWENAIKTDSNLSYDILQQILAVLGIDHQPYETKQILIDEKLRGQRNQIAHGQFLNIDVDSYRELHQEVIGMMDFFRDQIEEHAKQELYLRASKSTVKDKLV